MGICVRMFKPLDLLRAAQREIVVLSDPTSVDGLSKMIGSLADRVRNIGYFKNQLELDGEFNGYDTILGDNPAIRKAMGDAVFAMWRVYQAKAEANGLNPLDLPLTGPAELQTKLIDNLQNSWVEETSDFKEEENRTTEKEKQTSTTPKVDTIKAKEETVIEEISNDSEAEEEVTLATMFDVDHETIVDTEKFYRAFELTEDDISWDDVISKYLSGYEAVEPDFREFFLNAVTTSIVDTHTVGSGRRAAGVAPGWRNPEEAFEALMKRFKNIVELSGLRENLRNYESYPDVFAENNPSLNNAYFALIAMRHLKSFIKDGTNNGVILTVSDNGKHALVPNVAGEVRVMSGEDHKTSGFDNASQFVKMLFETTPKLVAEETSSGITWKLDNDIKFLNTYHKKAIASLLASFPRDPDAFSKAMKEYIDTKAKGNERDILASLYFRYFADGIQNTLSGKFGSIYGLDPNTTVTVRSINQITKSAILNPEKTDAQARVFLEELKFAIVSDLQSISDYEIFSVSNNSIRITNQADNDIIGTALSGWEEGLIKDGSIPKGVSNQVRIENRNGEWVLKVNGLAFDIETPTNDGKIKLKINENNTSNVTNEALISKILDNMKAPSQITNPSFIRKWNAENNYSLEGSPLEAALQVAYTAGLNNSDNAKLVREVAHTNKNGHSYYNPLPFIQSLFKAASGTPTLALEAVSGLGAKQSTYNAEGKRIPTTTPRTYVSAIAQQADNISKDSIYADTPLGTGEVRVERHVAKDSMVIDDEVVKHRDQTLAQRYQHDIEHAFADVLFKNDFKRALMQPIVWSDKSTKWMSYLYREDGFVPVKDGDLDRNGLINKMRDTERSYHNKLANQIIDAYRKSAVGVFLKTHGKEITKDTTLEELNDILDSSDWTNAQRKTLVELASEMNDSGSATEDGKFMKSLMFMIVKGDTKAGQPKKILKLNQAFLQMHRIWNDSPSAILYDENSEYTPSELHVQRELHRFRSNLIAEDYTYDHIVENKGQGAERAAQMNSKLASLNKRFDGGLSMRKAFDAMVDAYFFHSSIEGKNVADFTMGSLYQYDFKGVQFDRKALEPIHEASIKLKLYPTKDRSELTETELKEVERQEAVEADYAQLMQSMSSANVQQVKRAAGPGSGGVKPVTVAKNTLGAYLPESSKVSTLSDPESALVLLGTLEKQGVDVEQFDGTTFAHPLLLRLLNKSMGGKLANYGWKGGALKDLNFSRDPKTGLATFHKHATFDLFNNEILKMSDPELERMFIKMNSSVEFGNKQYLVPKVDENGVPVESENGTYELVPKTFNNIQEMWEYFGSTDNNAAWDNIADLIDGVFYGTLDPKSRLEQMQINTGIRDGFVHKSSLVTAEKTGNEFVNDWESVVGHNTLPLKYKEVSNDEWKIILDSWHNPDTTADYDLTNHDHSNQVSLITQAISSLLFRGTTMEGAKEVNSALESLTDIKLDEITNAIESSIEDIVYENRLEPSLSTNDRAFLDEWFKGDIEFKDANQDRFNELVDNMTVKGVPVTMLGTKEFILDSLRHAAKSETNKNIKDALDMASTSLDNGLLGNQVVSNTMAIFKKKGIKLKFAGGQYVVTASRGIAKLFRVKGQGIMTKQDMMKNPSIPLTELTDFDEKFLTSDYIVYVPNPNGEVQKTIVDGKMVSTEGGYIPMSIAQAKREGRLTTPGILVRKYYELDENGEKRNDISSELQYHKYTKQGVDLTSSAIFKNYDSIVQNADEFIDINLEPSEALNEADRTKLAQDVAFAGELGRKILDSILYNDGYHSHDIHNNPRYGILQNKLRGIDKLKNLDPRKASELAFKVHEEVLKLISEEAGKFGGMKGLIKELKREYRFRLEQEVSKDTPSGRKKAYKTNSMEVVLPMMHKTAYNLREGDTLISIMGYSSDPKDQRDHMTKFFTERMQEDYLLKTSTGGPIPDRLTKMQKSAYADGSIQGLLNDLNTRLETATGEEKTQIEDELTIVKQHNNAVENGEDPEVAWVNITEDVNAYRTEKAFDKIKGLAIGQAQDFPKTLDVFVARIPLDSKKLADPGRVVAFSDSQANSIMSPAERVATSGEDFDIDKDNIMVYEVDRFGRIYNVPKWAMEGKSLLSQSEIKAKLEERVLKFEENFTKDNTRRKEIDKELAEINDILKDDTLSEEDQAKLRAEAGGLIDERNSLSPEKSYKDIRDAVRKYREGQMTKLEKGMKNRVFEGIMKVFTDPSTALELTEFTTTETLQGVKNEVLNKRLKDDTDRLVDIIKTLNENLKSSNVVTTITDDIIQGRKKLNEIEEQVLKDRVERKIDRLLGKKMSRKDTVIRRVQVAPDMFRNLPVLTNAGDIQKISLGNLKITYYTGNIDGTPVMFKPEYDYTTKQLVLTTNIVNEDGTLTPYHDEGTLVNFINQKIPAIDGEQALSVNEATGRLVFNRDVFIKGFEGDFHQLNSDPRLLAQEIVDWTAEGNTLNKEFFVEGMPATDWSGYYKNILGVDHHKYKNGDGSWKNSDSETEFFNDLVEAAKEFTENPETESELEAWNTAEKRELSEEDKAEIKEYGEKQRQAILENPSITTYDPVLNLPEIKGINIVDSTFKETIPVKISGSFYKVQAKKITIPTMYVEVDPETEEETEVHKDYEFYLAPTTEEGKYRLVDAISGEPFNFNFGKKNRNGYNLKPSYSVSNIESLIDKFKKEVEADGSIVDRFRESKKVMPAYLLESSLDNKNSLPRKDAYVKSKGIHASKGNIDQVVFDGTSYEVVRATNAKLNVSDGGVDATFDFNYFIEKDGNDYIYSMVHPTSGNIVHKLTATSKKNFLDQAQEYVQSNIANIKQDMKRKYKDLPPKYLEDAPIIKQFSKVEQERVTRELKIVTDGKVNFNTQYVVVPSNELEFAQNLVINGKPVSMSSDDAAKIADGTATAFLQDTDADLVSKYLKQKHDGRLITIKNSDGDDIRKKITRGDIVKVVGDAIVDGSGKEVMTRTQFAEKLGFEDWQSIGEHAVEAEDKRLLAFWKGNDSKVFIEAEDAENADTSYIHKTLYKADRDVDGNVTKISLSSNVSVSTLLGDINGSAFASNSTQAKFRARLLRTLRYKGWDWSSIRSLLRNNEDARRLATILAAKVEQHLVDNAIDPVGNNALLNTIAEQYIDAFETVSSNKNADNAKRRAYAKTFTLYTSAIGATSYALGEHGGSMGFDQVQSLPAGSSSTITAGLRKAGISYSLIPKEKLDILSQEVKPYLSGKLDKREVNSIKSGMNQIMLADEVVVFDRINDRDGSVRSKVNKSLVNFAKDKNKKLKVYNFTENRWNIWNGSEFTPIEESEAVLDEKKVAVFGNGSSSMINEGIESLLNNTLDQSTDKGLIEAAQEEGSRIFGYDIFSQTEATSKARAEQVNDGGMIGVGIVASQLKNYATLIQTVANVYEIEDKVKRETMVKYLDFRTAYTMPTDGTAITRVRQEWGKITSNVPYSPKSVYLSTLDEKGNQKIVASQKFAGTKGFEPLYVQARLTLALHDKNPQKFFETHSREELVAARKNIKELNYEGHTDQQFGEWLNASTDNAKEQILLAINANGDTLPMILGLVNIGFELDDIARFVANPELKGMSPYDIEQKGKITLDQFPGSKDLLEKSLRPEFLMTTDWRTQKDQYRIRDIDFAKLVANVPADNRPQIMEWYKQNMLWATADYAQSNGKILSVLAKYLKTNVDTFSDAAGKYKFVKGIENTIESLTAQGRKLNKLDRSKGFKFDIEKFVLGDPNWTPERLAEHRESVIARFEGFKDAVNIPLILSQNAQFMATLKVVLTGSRVLDNVQSTPDVVKAVEGALKHSYQDKKSADLGVSANTEFKLLDKHKSLKDTQIKMINDAYRSAMINAFLKDQQVTEFDTGFGVYDLTSYEGRSTFLKHLASQVRDVYKKHVDAKGNPNMALQNLNVELRPEMHSGLKKSAYIVMNDTTLMPTSTQAAINSAMASLVNSTDPKERQIANNLWMYNLIVNNGSRSRKAFTEIFPASMSEEYNAFLDRDRIKVKGNPSIMKDRANAILRSLILADPTMLPEVMFNKGIDEEAARYGFDSGDVYRYNEQSKMLKSVFDDGIHINRDAKLGIVRWHPELGRFVPFRRSGQAKAGVFDFTTDEYTIDGWDYGIEAKTSTHGMVRVLYPENNTVHGIDKDGNMVEVGKDDFLAQNPHLRITKEAITEQPWESREGGELGDAPTYTSSLYTVDGYPAKFQTYDKAEAFVNKLIVDKEVTVNTKPAISEINATMNTDGSSVVSTMNDATQEFRYLVTDYINNTHKDSIIKLSEANQLDIMAKAKSWANEALDTINQSIVLPRDSEGNQVEWTEYRSSIVEELFTPETVMRFFRNPSILKGILANKIKEVHGANPAKQIRDIDTDEVLLMSPSLAEILDGKISQMELVGIRLKLDGDPARVTYNGIARTFDKIGIDVSPAFEQYFEQFDYISNGKSLMYDSKNVGLMPMFNNGKILKGKVINKSTLTLDQMSELAENFLNKSDINENGSPKASKELGSLPQGVKDRSRKTALKGGKLFVESLTAFGGVEADYLTKSDIIRIYGRNFGDKLGFVINGKMIINTSKATTDTPFHEFAHIWLEHLKVKDVDQYREVLKDADSLSVAKEVSSKYPELSGWDLKEEIFVTALGLKAGNKFLDKKSTKKAKRGFLGWLRNALSNFFGINSSKLPYDIKTTDTVETIIDKLSDEMVFGSKSMLNSFDNKTRQELRTRATNELDVDILTDLLEQRGFIKYVCE